MPRKSRRACPTADAIWSGRKGPINCAFMGSRGVAAAIAAVCHFFALVLSISESLSCLTSRRETLLTRARRGQVTRLFCGGVGQKSRAARRRLSGRSCPCPAADGITSIRRSGKKATTLRPVRRGAGGYGSAASTTGHAGSSEEMRLPTAVKLCASFLAPVPSNRVATRGNGATFYRSCIFTERPFIKSLSGRTVKKRPD